MARVKTNSAMRAGMFVMFPVVMLLVSFLRSSLALESESNRAIQEAKDPHEFSSEPLAKTSKADKPMESTPGAGPENIAGDIGDVGERKLELSELSPVGSEYESDAGLRRRRPSGTRISTQPEEESHESASRLGKENIAGEPGEVGMREPESSDRSSGRRFEPDTVAELERASRMLSEQEYGAYAMWFWGRVRRPRNTPLLGSMLIMWISGLLISYACDQPELRSHPATPLFVNIVHIILFFMTALVGISSML